MQFLYLFALAALPFWNTSDSDRHVGNQTPPDREWADIGQQTEPIPTNPTVFKKSNDAKQLIKSKVNASACYYDSKKWSFSKHENKDSEFVFQLKSAPVQAMMLCEKSTVPLLIHRDAVFANIQKIVPDARVTHQEYRNVNGQNVLQIEITATVGAYPCVYWGYLVSSSAGSTTWLAFGTQELVSQNKADIETLMNGLVKQ